MSDNVDETVFVTVKGAEDNGDERVTTIDGRVGEAERGRAGRRGRVWGERVGAEPGRDEEECR